jgi:hypothetical protein
MTQEMLRNIETVQKAVKNHGLGSQYDQTIHDGIAKGLKEIPLEPLAKQYGDNEWMQWEPRVAEGSKGRHYFQGFQASLIINDELIATNYYGNYRMAGMTTEQSRMHLHGGTVLHKEYLDSKEAITQVYSKAQFPEKAEMKEGSQEHPQLLKKGEKLPNLTVPSDYVDFAQLVSTEEFIASPERKQKALQDLQEGKVVDVMIWHREENKKPEQRRVFMELSLDSKESMSLILSTPEGKFLRKNEIEISSYANVVSEGKVIGNLDEMPDKVKSLFGSIAQGNRPEDMQTQRQNPARYRLGSAAGGAAATAPESKGNTQQPETAKGEGKDAGKDKATQVLENVKNKTNPRMGNGIN